MTLPPQKQKVKWIMANIPFDENTVTFLFYLCKERIEPNEHRDSAQI
jgi:hypothetical protein